MPKSSGCVSAVQLLFSLLSSKCRFSLGLNGSFLLFKNNPAWQKPACKHEQVTKCANCLLRRRASAVKLHTGCFSRKCVSVIHRPALSSHLSMGSFHGRGEKPPFLALSPRNTNCAPVGIFPFLLLFSRNGAVALHCWWPLHFSRAGLGR